MTWLRIALPVGIILILAALFILWQRAEGQLADTSARLAIAERDNDRLIRRNTDLETEALERLIDATAIEKLGKDMNDAITAIPPAQRDVAPSAATVALGCVRLRAAGATGDTFKRICGTR